MIRHTHDNDFLLIAQDDHAQLSGKLAEQLGNAEFAAPTPIGPAVAGVRMHDAGWPLHDEQPTLNADGWPLDVLETPPDLAVRVWNESVRRAAEHDAYAGLLVSLHVMALSAIAQTTRRSRLEQFELSKFQHRQVEVQEGLRVRLGMAIDAPLQMGLSVPGTSAGEDLLRFNYNLLKLLDRISLDVCSGRELFHAVEGVYARPAGEGMTITVGHPGKLSICIDPWPFRVARFDEPVSCRRVLQRNYANEEEFREVFVRAPTEFVEIHIVPV